MAYTQPNLIVGAIAPNFECSAASGPLKFHQWIGESWSIAFSHPGSAFMNELTELAHKLPDIQHRSIKVIGFSRNWPTESLHWKTLLRQHYGQQPLSGRDVEIIADDQGRISSLYGMLPQGNSKGVTSSPNTAFLVDPRKIIRLILAYPSSLSNGLSQMLQFIDDNSGPLQGIPTELFGLDAEGRGKIYKSEVQISSGGSGATVGVMQAAVGVVNNVKDTAGTAVTTGGDGDTGSLNVAASTATDYIQHALTVMDSLADLGKVMPFVAPAFVIIKAIIAVEQRARDVDAKCTDLVQRVTFMLSHLPALKNITVTDSTRQIIDRMNDVLKKSAALIQTYRKQSAIARRLSVHNKDRFASCATSLKDCTNDLMVSLQIHQSAQLDILTRPVPSDPEDEAAEKFVAAHGGLDAVKGSEELVKRFASEMKLSVDEKVMEQLNTNITEVLQQNQDRLEESLNESVSASVIEGIKGLAAQMTESSKEQKFVCVQCGEEYHDSTNGKKSCSFHRARYDSRNKTYACCSTSNPCQAGRHRSEHHCDYVYGNFFDFAGDITGYVDTVDKWTSVEDVNFDTWDKITASVGRLLRWKSRGAIPELPTILVTVGKVSISTPYLFKTFNTYELEVASKVADITHQTVIFRTSRSKEQYAMAEWVLSAEGVITGITITVKASTSSTPFIRFCPINIAAATLSGEVQAISEGGLRSYRPSTPYVLPEVQRVSATLPEKALREVRKDFKTRTSPNLPIVLKVVSDPPLSANSWSSKHDLFSGTISVFNKHPPKSMEPISISSVTAFYRLIGDESYKPAQSIQLEDRIVLPVTIDPRQTWTMKFTVVVPRSEGETNIEMPWQRSSFVARERPLRMKLVLTDVEEEECSLVIDYVSPALEPQKAMPKDIAFFYIDDPHTLGRYGVHVIKGNAMGPLGGQFSLVIGNNTVGQDWMKKTIYKALKLGESEIDTNFGQNNNPGKTNAWSWKCWALIDLSCQRLYAFKILITKDIIGTKGFACLGYVACPELEGVDNETRPIQYATEMTKFPGLEPYAPSLPPLLDDQFDDVVPETPKTAAGAVNSSYGVAGSSTQLTIPEELNQRLTSIDHNLSSIKDSLSRIATSFEQFVETLKSK